MAWDGLQKFLIGHFVGIRHQGHRTYAWYQQGRFPSREVGERLSTEGLPVFEHKAVGYPSWVLPGVAILDGRGLNDLVVARTKPQHTGQIDRVMAHDRLAPRSYVTCFRPNVRISETGAVTVTPRKEPLRPEDVVRCEDTWMARVSQPDAP